MDGGGEDIHYEMHTCTYTSSVMIIIKKLLNPFCFCININVLTLNVSVLGCFCCCCFIVLRLNYHVLFSWGALVLFCLFVCCLFVYLFVCLSALALEINKLVTSKCDWYISSKYNKGLKRINWYGTGSHCMVWYRIVSYHNHLISYHIT